MKKAIFFDIDGTIVAQEQGIKEITPRVATAMKNLQRQGNYIFIATGRPHAFIHKFLKDFGFDGFVLSNGALIFVGGELIFQDELNPALIKTVCDIADAENVEYILESYPNTYFRKNSPAAEAFLQKIKVDYSKFIRDFDIEKISVSKIECLSNRKDFEELDKVYKKMLATPGLKGWADPFHYKSMEIYSDTISKATGILKVLKHLNIDVKNSYAFGDGYNDVEMIQTVGTGFAMATAKDNLKQFADYVVPSVQDDGVAVGIEKYIL